MHPWVILGFWVIIWRDRWLAREAMASMVRGAGFGLLGNIVVGIIGALVAGWVLPQLGIVLASGLLGSILDATAGGGSSVLVILSLIRRAWISTSHPRNDRRTGGRFLVWRILPRIWSSKT